MVATQRVLTPQEYVDRLVGPGRFTLPGYNGIDEIQQVLNRTGYDAVWDHALTEIQFIVEENLDVVLVACQVRNNPESPASTVYRWYEVPEGEIFKFTQEGEISDVSNIGTFHGSAQQPTARGFPADGGDIRH